jgi:two-component system sensor histidine kinase DesK
MNAWTSRLGAWFAQLDARVLPPVLEPGAMPWYSLFYLSFPLLPALIPGFPQPNWWLTFLAIGAFLPIYFGFYWTRGWRRIGLLLAMSALTVALFPANWFATTFAIFAAVLSAFLSWGTMLVILLLTQGLVAAALSWMFLSDFAGNLAFFLITFVSAVVSALCNRFWIHNARKNQALRLSQDEVRRLAQVAERERIGRDLHDLLGHTLSVIALKSELAARLFARDAHAAQREIADVERVAREALGQVRRAVTGMRAMGMRAELANARLALAAVTVDFEYETDDAPLHPEVETVLALALREAATNVIRHAGARRCHARVGREGESIALTVRDDGVGGARDCGNGLAGMRERVQALGGTFEIESEPGRGTVIAIAMPYRAPPDPETVKPAPNTPRRLAAVR